MSEQTETVTILPAVYFTIPDDWYLCEQVEVGLLSGAEHPMHAEPDNGMYRPEDLWQASFVIEEYEAQFSGFWCKDCLLGLGITAGISLADYIRGTP